MNIEEDSGAMTRKNEFFFKAENHFQ